MLPAAHTGLAYQSVDEFLTAATPYIQNGLAAGDAVIAVTTQTNINALRSALGTSAKRVEFAHSGDWYESPARGFSKYMRFWDDKRRSGSTGLRILGEPIVQDAVSDDVARWAVLESAVNGVLNDAAFSMMCPYDLRIPLLKRDCVERTHPHLAGGAGIHPSPGFIEPRAFAASLHAKPLPVPASGLHVQTFDKEGLAGVRASIRRIGAEMGLGGVRLGDLVVAVSEAGANAVEHGGGGGVLRTWRSGNEVVCDVVSRVEHVMDATQGYFLPPAGAGRGRGIWIMRQLCDWVDIRPHPEGLVVRLYMRLSSKAAPPA